MSEKIIQYEVNQNVAWITINRPGAYNALDLDAMKEIFEVANRCSSDRSVRAAVLTGAGAKSFCAGGDVGGFAGQPETVDLLLKEMTAYLHAAISRLAWMDAPLIAMVNGAAAGAGLSLVAACDLAIASEKAKFSSAYTLLGLSPDASSTYFLPRLIGSRRATELFLTNRTLSAQEALAWGLVNEIVPTESLKERVQAIATQLSRGPTKAYGGVKRLMQMSSQEGLESQMEREGRQIAELGRSQDGLEGVLAFVERRKANFNGR